VNAIVGFVGAAVQKAGVALWQVYRALTDDVNDVEPFGEADVLQCLGVTSQAFPKTDEGYVECVGITGIGGRNLCIVGARDTRTASIAGRLSPGDTCVHTTGPGNVAQLHLKQEKKAAALVVTDVNGKNQVLLLDGKNRKFQLFVNGAAIEINPDGDISLLGKSGGGILIQGNEVAINGVLKLPGMPPGMVLMAGPPSGSPGAAASAPLFPVMNVGGYT
jgi:hypothetical protein